MKTAAVPTLSKALSASALLRQSALETLTQWAAPAPLWAGQTDPAGMRQPILLRFTSDTFMEDLQAVLNSQMPGQISAYTAVRESFAEPLPKAIGITRPAPPNLKLYQPAHGHFYLVAASLVCRQTGLPDRALESGQSVGFVLRRLDAQGNELAWVSDESGKGRLWQSLSAQESQGLAKDSQGQVIEEVFPLFPLTYCDGGRKRRVLAGLVPTSSRETFKAAAALPILPSPAEAEADRAKLDPRLQDPRLDELEGKVLARLEQFEGIGGAAGSAEGEASLFILLDLMEWLFTYLPGFAQKIVQNDKPTGGDFKPLTDLLVGRLVPGGTSWWDALRQVWQDREKIYQTQPGTPQGYNLRGMVAISSDLRQKITALKSSFSPPDAGDSGGASDPGSRAMPQWPKLEAFAPGERPLYVLRCLYRRPGCPELLSPPCEKFEIAAFFDPDAPARPVRISLPDTSLANLRKYRKNVSFLMSKELRKQMQSVSDAKEALKGNIGSSPSFDLGLICSFSIPIITICAFIVLMIFLVLLNLVFWWLPFFRICFPIKR